MRILFSALIAVLLAGPVQAATFTAQSESDNRGAQHWDLTGIYRAEIFRQSLAAVGTPTLVGMPQAVPQGILDSLSFTTSPEVERATRQKLLASVLEVVEGDRLEEEIRLTVRSDDLWRQFTAVAEQAGLSIYNMADVTAATYLIAWQVLNSNDSSAGAGAAAIRAVRDSIASGMALQGQVPRMSAPEKQQAASVMAYMVTIAANSVNELHRSGNEDALARLREHLHAVFLSVGVDLDRLRLTEQGFVER
ncbi:MAG: hypothetical protein Kow00114_37700 [Kiloniellaceae bacterium]